MKGVIEKLDTEAVAEESEIPCVVGKLVNNTNELFNDRNEDYLYKNKPTQEANTTQITDSRERNLRIPETTSNEMKKCRFKVPNPNTDFAYTNKALLDKPQTSQSVIESLRNTKIEEARLYKDEPNRSIKYRLVPVDWLGLPLTASTLPDFISTSKLHFKRPLSTPASHHRHSVPVLKPTNSFVPSREQALPDQFLGVSWVTSDPFPPNISGGYLKKRGQMAETLVQPKTSIWNIPQSMADRIRKKDPMEYINLLDPEVIIPSETAFYKWLIRDQGEVGLNITLGKSASESSGFSRNRPPYLSSNEDRDFRSVYKKSYSDCLQQNDIEGLCSLQYRPIKYPGCGGGRTMRDFPSSFERFGENLLKSDPDFTKNGYRRIKSARPFL